MDILLDVIGGVERARREGCPRTTTDVSQHWFSGHFRQVFPTPFALPRINIGADVWGESSIMTGGQNVLQSTLQYGYEHFLEQVNLAEQLTSSDFGISTGLINQNYWENSKWYFVNVERGYVGDKLTGRNINVSFY